MADILSIGNTGLNASRKSLETTGHNIANVNTKGYSRQRVLQKAIAPYRGGDIVQGVGVEVTNIKRAHSPHIQKNLMRHTSEHEFYKTRSEEMSRIESIFNEIDGDGLNQVLNKFYNAFRGLSAQPENETTRSIVRDSATIVVKDFHRIQDTLNRLSADLDNRIIIQVEDINSSLKKVAKLNGNIAFLEKVNGETGDLRDQRDVVLERLSRYLKIKTYRDNRGNFIVSAKGAGTLVEGKMTQELGTGSISKRDSSDGRDGSIEIFLKNRPSQKITKFFEGGETSSLIKIRNQDIGSLRKTIDQIAFDFANTVNAIHRNGYVNRQVEIDNNGQAVTLDRKGATTGINFFKIANTQENAALSLELSDEIKNDLSNIVTALEPNSPGDNRIALGISKLQYEKFMEGGTATIEEHFLKSVGRVGIEAGKAKLDAEQADGILSQAKDLRERLSGVNLDEETASLIRFQQAYQASAKIMQTADEMFKTVLNLKR